MRRTIILTVLFMGSCMPKAPTATVPARTTTVSPTQQINNRYASDVSARIAGHEKDPAEKVFKNVQIPWLKNVPAETFLAIMNEGYSRALGVTCKHCHDDHDFASDAKRTKLAAREMAVMHHAINEQLVKMQHLELTKEERFINCRTCHRGAINPREASSR
jgi:hypothetical protein